MIRIIRRRAASMFPTLISSAFLASRAVFFAPSADERLGLAAGAAARSVPLLRPRPCAPMEAG